MQRSETFHDASDSGAHCKHHRNRGCSFTSAMLGMAVEVAGAALLVLIGFVLAMLVR